MSRKLFILLSLAIGLCCLGVCREAFSSSRDERDSGGSSPTDHVADRGSARATAVSSETRAGSYESGSGGGSGSAGAGGLAAGGGEEGTSSEEDIGEDEETVEDLPYLSGKGWFSYQHLGAEPAHGLEIYGIDALKEYLKKILYYDGMRTESCKDIGSTRKEWRATNTVVVHVFYKKDSGAIHHHRIPYIFISGWDHTYKGFESRAETKVISEHFERADSPLWIGDFYRLPADKKIGSTLVASIHGVGGRSLIEDYAARGLDISPREEKQRGKQKKIVNKLFSPSTYGHSEQAFISYLQNGHAIGLNPVISADVVPTSIMLLVVSTNAPCGICNSVMRNLIEDVHFKSSMLQSMFPRITADIPLSIVYGAVDPFGKRRISKEGDLTGLPHERREQGVGCQGRKSIRKR